MHTANFHFLADSIEHDWLEFCRVRPSWMEHELVREFRKDSFDMHNSQRCAVAWANALRQNLNVNQVRFDSGSVDWSVTAEWLGIIEQEMLRLFNAIGLGGTRHDLVEISPEMAISSIRRMVYSELVFWTV